MRADAGTAHASAFDANESNPSRRDRNAAASCPLTLFPAASRAATNPPTSCAIRYGITSFRGELPRRGEPEGHGGLEVAAGDVSERRDRKREAKAERQRDPEVADSPAPISTETAIALKPRKKNRTVPSASAARRRPIDDASISPTSF
jgi:hypothetical protein